MSSERSVKHESSVEHVAHNDKTAMRSLFKTIGVHPVNVRKVLFGSDLLVLPFESNCMCGTGCN